MYHGTDVFTETLIKAFHGMGPILPSFKVKLNGV